MTTNGKHFKLSEEDEEDTPYTTLRIFENAAIDSIIGYSRFKVKCAMAFQQARKEFIVIDWICAAIEIALFWTRRFFAKLAFRRVEPVTNSWVSIYCYDAENNASAETNYPVKSSGMKYLDECSDAVRSYGILGTIDSRELIGDRVENLALKEMQTVYNEAIDLALLVDETKLMIAQLDRHATIIRRFTTRSSISASASIVPGMPEFTARSPSSIVQGIPEIENAIVSEDEFSNPKKSDAFFLYVDYFFEDQAKSSHPDPVKLTTRSPISAGASIVPGIPEPLFDQKLSVSRREPISLEIPRSHFVVGNDLLSREYIVRYLEYSAAFEKWQFSGKYRLEIADIFGEKTELNETQWIRLTEDGYVIFTENVSKGLTVENAGAGLNSSSFEYYSEN